MPQENIRNRQEEAPSADESQIAGYKDAANVERLNVKFEGMPEEQELNEAIINVSDYLKKSQDILAEIKRIKSNILEFGTVEIGSEDFNHIVESLRVAGATHGDETKLAKRLVSGDVDSSLEAEYTGHVKSHEDHLIRLQTNLKNLKK